jgi:hypothetical protein
VVLSDDVGNSSASNIPIFTAVTIDPYGNRVATYQYNQDQLPATLSFQSSYRLNLSFACSFSANAYSYSYSGDTYGIGYSPCGASYIVYGGSYEVLYTKAPSPTTSTSTTVPSTTVPPTTTIQNYSSSSTTTIAPTTAPTTTVPATTTIALNMSPPLGFPGGTVAVRQQNRSHISISVVNDTFSVERAFAISRISAFGISIVGNAAGISGPVADLTLNYSCSYPPGSVTPYLLENSSWVRIYNYTINARACSLSMPISRNSTVVLFFAQKPPMSPASHTGALTYWAAAGVAALLIIALYALIRRSRARRRARPPHRPHEGAPRPVGTGAGHARERHL